MKLISANRMIDAIKDVLDGKIAKESLLSYIEDNFCEGEVIKWIKVEDELPKKYGVYLVTLNNYNTDFCVYYPDKKSFGFNNQLNDEVTAWSYLPKPLTE